MILCISAQQFPIAGRFTISRGAKTEAAVVLVTLATQAAIGWGECVPYARYGETIDSVIAQLESVNAAVSAADLISLDARSLLPAGAARNALDCALLDWRAKKLGTTVAALLGLKPPAPVTTAYTISLGTAADMRVAAAKAAARPLLKIKLGTPEDIDRLKAVRDGAPNATLIVDANEGWSLADLDHLLPTLVAEKVALIEQPLPADNDAALKGFTSPIPLCADESMHSARDVAALADRYSAINIKLDKTGGLTEALDAVRAGQAANLLAMAPALLLTPFADFVDLDGPLLLATDRSPSLRFEGSTLFPPEPSLWG
jgi:L-Ala-D/L-Glu epimerase